MTTITYKRCWLADGCPSKTGACSSCGPDDDGCPVYMYFQKKILAELQERTNHQVCVNCPLQPVKITWQQGKAYCGSCGKRIPAKIKANYCHKCGREIAWV